MGLLSILWQSSFARGLLAALALTAALGVAAWRVHHAGYTAGLAVGQHQMDALRASYVAQIAAANAKAAAKARAWQEAADKLQSQYISERTAADAATRALDQALAKTPGAGDPLPPYLGHAAGLLYGSAGTPR